ncbi:ABC transporter substrate-binding protein [Georgenia sp. EYE_87]|uniref:ABC transporter substrate-binding protein n=1 Tax=Georgenia sp. EYE_87 TaxID=2853448 RepID=UPI002003001A|nr:ABC transporter substrate-binding protein [Georgenia sp. EYE_87]MCK6212113.1 ABC transporter substrate-binding protein [Georgenia sp. EYE_87]
MIRQLYFVPPVPLLIAEELGLLATAGLDLESRRTRSSAEQLDGLRSGEVDVAVTAMDTVFVWNEHGADVRIVAEVERTTPLGVYATPGHRALADLDGARFAVDALTNGFAIIARTLASAGIRPTYVEIGGVTERLDALVAGAADATLLGPPLDRLAERAGMVRLASANDAFPALPGQGLVVRARCEPQEQAALDVYLGVLEAAVRATESMSDREGVTILERHGFPARAAADVWTTRPRSTVVDADGLALLEGLRAGLDLLPEGYTGIGSILDAARLPPADQARTTSSVS